jgi:hypothetical protein
MTDLFIHGGSNMVRPAWMQLHFFVQIFFQIFVIMTDLFIHGGSNMVRPVWMQLHYSYIFCLFLFSIYIFSIFLRAQLCMRAVQAEDNYNKKSEGLYSPPTHIHKLTKYFVHLKNVMVNGGNGIRYHLVA